MSEEREGLVDKIEDFLHIGEPGPETVEPAVEKTDEDGTEEFNPPTDWAPAEPPTAADEEEKLAEAFGEPVNGVYAPHVEGVQ